MLILLCIMIWVVYPGACSAKAHTSEPGFITDDRGRKIIVHRPFNRIISLYGAHTENLFHLGLDANIIGVSLNDDRPVQVTEKQRFSYHDDPEKFLAHQPDLVLIRPMIDLGYPGLVQRLERSGITVVSLQPNGIEKMYAYWKILGRLTGKEKNAEEMIRMFKKKVGAVQEMTSRIHPKKRVYFEAIHSRMKTFTQGAMPIFALETAGGINVASDAIASRNTNIANYSKERILAHAARIDVFLAQIGRMNRVSIEQIKKEPGFQIIKAVQNNQIYLIDESIISRPVPGLYKGILAIGRALYPEHFKTIKE